MKSIRQPPSVLDLYCYRLHSRFSFDSYYSLLNAEESLHDSAFSILTDTVVDLEMDLMDTTK